MGRVLITGATGFLGGAVLDALAAQGVPVLAHGRSRAGCAALLARGVPVLRHDLSGPLPEEALEGVETVVHCAALSAPVGPWAAFERANVTGTRHLLEASRRARVRRVILVSSSSVCFAPRDQLGVGEDDPLPPPFTHYAASKRMAEDLALGSGLGVIVLRPRGIYGRGDTSLLPRLLDTARRGALPRLRGGRARIDLTHVDDAVSAVRAALCAPNSAEGRVYNVSGGEVLPVSHIVEGACDRAGVEVRWRDVPLGPALAFAGLVERLAAWRGRSEPRVTRYGLALFAYAQSLDIGRAGRVLGWRPQVSFAEGLERTFGAP